MTELPPEPAERRRHTALRFEVATAVGNLRLARAWRGRAMRIMIAGLLGALVLSILTNPLSCFAIVGASILAFLLAGSFYATSGAYRELHRWRVRREMRGIPAHECLEILRAIGDEGGDESRAFVGPLITQMRARTTEVTPAAAPGGGGAEVSPPAEG